MYCNLNLLMIVNRRIYKYVSADKDFFKISNHYRCYYFEELVCLPYSMKLLTFIYLLLFSVSIQGFAIDHAKKLSGRLETMIKCPKYEYLPKLRKYLNLYSGVLSFITLKIKGKPVDPTVERLYRLGSPEFLKEPVEDNRVGFKKTLRWTDRDMDTFIDEFNDAKKIWSEFEKQIKSKVNSS